MFGKVANKQRTSRRFGDNGPGLWQVAFLEPGIGDISEHELDAESIAGVGSVNGLDNFPNEFCITTA